jgi:HEAT repeat protein
MDAAVKALGRKKVTTMKSNTRSHYVFWLALLAIAPHVHADGDGGPAVVYDRVRGELSPNTEAPSPERMVNAITSGSPTKMTALLEYGERVECMECIPLLQKKLLESDKPQVREMAAWWLRKRPFGYGRVAVQMRDVAVNDSDPVRRARAAEALGEFMDVKGLPALQNAAMLDDARDVRLAAVKALGRLNARAGHPAVVAAFEDEDAQVRRAALDQVTKLVFFADRDAVAAKLDDDDAGVRLRAAQLVGELRAQSATAGLADLLANDAQAGVRQAAAWALGRVGGAAARSALQAAKGSERDPGVSDAIDVALQM